MALRRIAPSMEDSKEGKSIDCISQHTVISWTCGEAILTEDVEAMASRAKAACQPYFTVEDLREG